MPFIRSLTWTSLGGFLDDHKLSRNEIISISPISDSYWVNGAIALKKFLIFGFNLIIYTITKYSQEVYTLI